MNKFFFILIKDPISDSLLGWCHSEDLENLRRAYPYLIMSPLPARTVSEDDMNAGTVYCGPEACQKHPSIPQLLKLHDDLAREKKDPHRLSPSISKQILESLKKRQEDECPACGRFGCTGTISEGLKNRSEDEKAT